MAMSKRFFIKLASQYREARPPIGAEPGMLAVWEHMVVITANALATQNSFFKIDRFYEACGFERVGTPTP
jgi:hypothetical protein